MASINGHIVTIPGGTIPSGAVQPHMINTTNSPLSQTVTISDSKTTKVLSGQGERTRIGDVDLTQFDLSKDWTITLQYSEAGSDALSPSTPRTGGPYTVGKVNFFMVVAENGDDTDFDDCTCQITWKS